MAPSWSRQILFAEPNAPSTNMWDRPATNQPIFVYSLASPASPPMWSRPSTQSPIFEEAVLSPSLMWSREATGVPVCPCCVRPEAPKSPELPLPPTNFNIPPPPIPESEPLPRTLRRTASSKSLGLKLKRSVKNLRRLVRTDSF